MVPTQAIAPPWWGEVGMPYRQEQPTTWAEGQGCRSHDAHQRKLAHESDLACVYLLPITPKYTMCFPLSHLVI